MNLTVEQNLLSKLRTLSAQQVAEVENFVEFLAAKSMGDAAAWDRLLAIAPALAAAGVEPLSDDEIDAEVQTVRASAAPTWLANPPRRTPARLALETNIMLSGNRNQQVRHATLSGTQS